MRLNLKDRELSQGVLHLSEGGLIFGARPYTYYVFYQDESLERRVVSPEAYWPYYLLRLTAALDLEACN